jgi:hypothetical protein
MKANTEKLNMGKRFIPREALNRLGNVFLNGRHYDLDDGIPNWKKGVFDTEYQKERLEHALDHIWRWIEGDREEDHLAKVMWFCAAQLELERIERETNNRVTAEIEAKITNNQNAYPIMESIIEEDDETQYKEVVTPDIKTIMKNITSNFRKLVNGN